MFAISFYADASHVLLHNVNGVQWRRQTFAIRGEGVITVVDMRISAPFAGR